MHLTVFLFGSIFFLVVIIFFAICERTNFLESDYNLLNENEPSALWVRIFYLIFFVGFIWLAISTINSYIYPKDEKVFSNVDYHVLSHKGYEVGDTFYLANGLTSEDDGNPDCALWDNKDGKVVLNRTDSCMIIQEFTEPLYVRKNSSYHLVNQVILEDISNGFVLSQDQDTVFALRIEPTADNNCLYISTVYMDDHTSITDTSSFLRTIHEGYPILDIIAKSPRIGITEDLERWFESAYLVRKEIPIAGKRLTFDPEHPSPLCLMPSSSFFQDINLRINGNVYDFKRPFNISFRDYSENGKFDFFSGLGKNRTEEFHLSVIPDNKMRLEFFMPNMRHIKASSGRVFINSSIDDVSKETLDEGYLYNKFTRETNVNHISAHMQYEAGNARSKLSIKYLDINGTTDSQSRYIDSNSEFLLHSKGKSPNLTSWIFEVTDLRATNELQSRTIFVFFLLMFGAIMVRIYCDSYFNWGTLSYTELGIYVILFSLFVVRLILGWRVSTFVPIEDISFAVFEKMKKSICDWTIWLIVFLPFGVTICVGFWKSLKWIRNVFNRIGKSFKWIGKLFKWIGKLFKWIGEKTTELLSCPWICCFIFVVILVICFILRDKSFLSRICNIPIPIISYFLYELWMNHLKEQDNQKNNKMQLILCRIIAFIFLLAYLFIADAGFIIIFLVYIIAYHFIFDILFQHFNRYYLIGLAFIAFAILFTLLRFEGEGMIRVFHHVDWFLVVFFAVLLVIAIISYKQFLSKNLRLWYCIIGVLSLGLGYFLLDANQKLPQEIISFSNFINSKKHMVYRAEIQRLSGDQKIDDLIKDSEFESSDFVYIMRSAHNQWFINQYIRAGKKMEENDEYFHIQPHSNQGATYPTQTTDLVVTRYILAEHGETVVWCILGLWLLLILIFVLEFKMSNPTNRLFLSGPLLLFIIALMVFLSATNRIVFVGQDFPMISLQSRVAVLFPLFLLSLLIGRSIFLRSQDDNYDSVDSRKIFERSGWFISFLILFYVLSIWCIEQKGLEQKETQFNVSRLISNLSIKVDDINERFEIFQESKADELKNKSINEVWESFIKDDNYNKVYFDYLNPETPDYFSSLLHFFNEKQRRRTDVNQLLHLRRRGRKCCLALNKQYYFIPDIMEEEYRWTGDIYAAKVEPKIELTANKKSIIKNTTNLDYDKNILVQRVQRQIPNMPLMRFSEAWTPNKTPLFLISSKQGTNDSEFFCIEADSFDIKGNGNYNQIATAVQPGDILSLYKKDPTKKNAETILNAKMTVNHTPFIVRNMWLNGHKRLFFPLGKQSMWTYHLGNLVSEVFSRNTSLKDTSMYLSLDYGLMKSLYDSINHQIRSKASLPTSIIEELSNFNEKSYDQQCDFRNSFYYDKSKKKIIVSNKANRNQKEAAAYINKELRKVGQSENPLSKALQNLLRMPYDFTTVAIDGDGHIRALIDYSRNRHVDPNNIAHLEKIISELYTEGTNEDEREIFGSKALQYIPSGPGSSFKPIAYTAIASQKRLNWDTINVTNIGMTKAKSTHDKTESGSKPYAYYGGISTINEEGIVLNIHGDKVNHDMYLVKSNNLYHSVIILLGMQNKDNVEKIMKPYKEGMDEKMAFPVFTYNGVKMCFDPDEWWHNKQFPKIEEHDLMTEGLFRNYHIKESAPRLSDFHAPLFGEDELVKELLKGGNTYRRWVFPETSSINNADRNLSPLKFGFNQILLGAYPLQMTPLQMAVNASRLASLNRIDNLTTILDGNRTKQYEFFDVDSINGGWNGNSYLDFMTSQVWTQLRKVPTIGTAKAMITFATNMENGKYGKSYYLYCKTGTLEDERDGHSQEDRIKPLLVIITDKPLENVTSIDQLKGIRYYALYISFLGINKNGFSPRFFVPFIECVLKSTSFKNYMK